MWSVCEWPYEINITELKRRKLVPKDETLNMLPVSIVCEANNTTR